MGALKGLDAECIQCAVTRIGSSSSSGSIVAISAIHLLRTFLDAGVLAKRTSPGGSRFILVRNFRLVARLDGPLESTSSTFR
jgi:hypothetical protein